MSGIYQQVGSNNIMTQPPLYAIKALLNTPDLMGKPVKVQGWVRSRRDSKAGLSFIALTDGSTFDTLQVIALNTLPNYELEILKLTKDCALSIEGTLVPSTGEGQAMELSASKIFVYGFVESPETYPISPKRHTVEHLREHAHLRIRTNLMGAISRVRHSIAHAIHQFFHEHDFFWVSTPILTSSDAEGAGELFRVSTLDLLNLPKKPNGQIDFSQDFFGKEAYLTVSGQLNGECYALGLGKIYTFGPTFRAENSHTSRHLAEFWMVEPEIAFADLDDVATLSEAMLKYIIKTLLAERHDDLKFFHQWVDTTCLTRLTHILETPFVHMEYTEAIEILQKSKKSFEYPVSWGIDLQSEHERYLCEVHIQGPVILKNYPKAVKSFYMRVNPDNKTVAAMDVLVPGIGEIIGGSQREERLEVLDARILESGMNPEDYHWYRDLRRFGTTPHAGFGLGFERLVSYLTGVANIRDISPFPRYPGHIEF